MKNNYNIKYLPSFYEEFEEILYYIKYKLKNKNAAENFIKNVENSIINRSKNPKNFEIYKSTKNRKYNWYKIYVGNFIIFYVVQDYTIIVAHIFYNKRNIEDLI